MTEHSPIVVCVHGTGGSAGTMAPIVDALRADGFEVLAPTLAGHGTVPEDLIGVTWTDWMADVPPAAIIVGQSMGGSLALARAALGDVTAGIVCINPVAICDPDALEGLEWQRSRGLDWVESGPADIRDPDAHDGGYERLPIETLLEMTRGVATIDLAAITVPVLLATSTHDNVVDPYHSDVVAETVTGPVERLRLPNSAHVATLDFDRDLLVRSIVEFSRAHSPRR